MFIVLTGVSGSGKTTVGKALAKDLGWRFHEGDDFHPAANIEKMRRGEPLTDELRKPWLDALRAMIQTALETARAAFSLVPL
jgi:carbohydrate kinase (thermoresistant glucokinase family)